MMSCVRGAVDDYCGSDAAKWINKLHSFIMGALIADCGKRRVNYLLNGG